MLIQSKSFSHNNFKMSKTTFSNNSLILRMRELSDEAALGLLNDELKKGMPSKEANSWMQKIKQICLKHGIRPKNLPINKNYPGSLSEEENSNIFTEIFYSIFSDTKMGKIELIAKEK